MRRQSPKIHSFRPLFFLSRTPPLIDTGPILGGRGRVVVHRCGTWSHLVTLHIVLHELLWSDSWVHTDKAGRSPKPWNVVEGPHSTKGWVACPAEEELQVEGQVYNPGALPRASPLLYLAGHGEVPGPQSGAGKEAAC